MATPPIRVTLLLSGSTLRVRGHHYPKEVKAKVTKVTGVGKVKNSRQDITQNKPRPPYMTKRHSLTNKSGGHLMNLAQL